nr:hypothetical protein [Tanacetum cinerariifolium]
MDKRTCLIKQKCVKSQSPWKFKRGHDIKIPQSGGPFKKGCDEAVHKELGDRMERATTTSSRLEAEQDSGGNTPGSEEGRMTINELTTQGRNEHKVEFDFDFTTAEDISTANVPVTTTGAEISTISPEDKTAETSNDLDDVTLVETLIEIRRSAIRPQKNYLKEKKKQLAAERSEAIRNKPPTRTQVGNKMVTYLKHMDKYTHQQLKHKSLEELQKLYQKEQKWIDKFKHMDDDKKTYPLTQERLSRMLNRTLEVDHESEMTDIETISIDDLYKNFKIIKQDVKKSVGISTSAQNMVFMTALSTSSTNDVNTANPAYKASTVSPNVNTASPQVSTANFSDNVVYAFMVENPNGSNLLQQDLEQIYEDDLEAIDLRWQLSLLSMRAKRYFQRTGKKIFINANDTAGYDKSKVECFNYHKMGHFARECREQRNQDGRFKNQDNTRKQENNKDTSSKAMLAIDGVGFDWSDIAEEQVQTNMALMAFSGSEVNNDKSCTKTCLKNYETLKKQCDDLVVKLNQTEFSAATYKRGLATVEEQLVTYKKNEVLFSEEVAVLKREVACKDYKINMLKSEFEKVKQEECIEFKIEKFNNASKSQDKLTGSQITDNNKKGLWYHVISPPHPLIYNGPTKLNLSDSGLDECKEPKFRGYGPRDKSKDTSSFVKSSLNVDKGTAFSVDKKIEFVKPKHHDKPVRRSVRPFNTAKPVYTAHPKPTVHSARALTHFSKQAQSTVQRHFYKQTALTNRYFHQKANTAIPRVVYTARLYIAQVNTVMAKRINVVKASGKPQKDDKGFIDSGCLRHVTRNIAYLSDFKEFNRGYVTFWGGAHV